jgi:large subunit ribosomal protein L15e
MSMYKYIRNQFNTPSDELLELQRKRQVEWRLQDSTVRIEHPTRLDRARSLGYKAKQGFVLVRQRVARGGHQRPDIKGGRRPKTSRQMLVLAKNYKSIAEERVCQAYPNCEVLNTYPVGKDGTHYWFEIILVDRNHPALLHDPRIRGVLQQRGRAHRGITQAGRRSRGLLHKGKGHEKARPSARAHRRRIN